MQVSTKPRALSERDAYRLLGSEKSLPFRVRLIRAVMRHVDCSAVSNYGDAIALLFVSLALNVILLSIIILFSTHGPTIIQAR